MNKKKIVVGMSGGVDSSTVAAILVDQGHDVTGITMKIWDGSIDVKDNGKHACYGPDEAEDIEDAQKICDKLGIKLKIIDLSKEYKSEVLDYFTKEYMSGRTPNPCVKCNLKLKFGLLLEKTIESGLDFDYFATGHYANIHKTESGRFQLKKATDEKKDQTYFLHALTSKQLSKVMFPLGNYEKHEVKEISKKYGLGVADRQESQNFIAGGHSCLFDGKEDPGNIIDAKGKVLGRHNGIFNYTIGQRRGMGIASEEPYYVIKIDSNKNQIIVGRQGDLYSDRMYINNPSWNTDIDLSKPINAIAKIRYAHKGGDAVITKEDGNYFVIFDKPQMSITPGQSVVFYIDDCVIGGGIIK